MPDSFNPSARQNRWRPTISFWIVAAVMLLFIAVCAAAGGVGAVLVLLGIVGLLTGLYALLFKRRSWVGIPHRKSAALVATAGIIAFFVGAGIGVATADPSQLSTASAPVETAATSATPTPTEASPIHTACLAAGESLTYSDETFVCAGGDDQRLLWVTESESKQLASAKKAQEKIAAEKVAKEKAAAEAAKEKEAAAKAAAAKAEAAKAAVAKAQAEKAAVAKAEAKRLAEAKAAADKLAAERAAAAKAVADQAAADQAAAQQAANQAAQQPAIDPNATTGATAQCNDGSLSFSATHRGTCSHHGGVAIWYK